MTILCITSDRLPGVRACTVRGRHLDTCTAETCPGCAPRAAQRGFLCQPCYERVEAALIEWPRFEAALDGVDRAVSVDTAGRSGSTLGWVPLPGTMLALDECRRLLASFPDGPRALDVWIATVDGARDAVMFAHAATRAYRTHEIEERKKKLRRVRCPNCGVLSLVRRPPQYENEPVVVECDDCGHVIREGREAHLYAPDPDGGWQTVPADAVWVIDEIERAGR